MDDSVVIYGTLTELEAWDDGGIVVGVYRVYIGTKFLLEGVVTKRLN